MVRDISLFGLVLTDESRVADEALSLNGCPHLHTLNLIVQAGRGARYDWITRFIRSATSLRIKHILVVFRGGVRSAAVNRMDWSDFDAQMNDREHLPSLQFLGIDGLELERSQSLSSLLPKSAARNILASNEKARSVAESLRDRDNRLSRG
jgi:hypothetical protein